MRRKAAYTERVAAALAVLLASPPRDHEEIRHLHWLRERLDGQMLRDGGEGLRR